MIVRELTSGIYFGEPRGIFNRGQRARRHQHPALHRVEIASVARSAFELARRLGNKVCSMEKANVMESGVLWREVVTEVHDANTPTSSCRTCMPMPARCSSAAGPSSST